jgi:DNA-directed RNA polymerase subunit L
MATKKATKKQKEKENENENENENILMPEINIINNKLNKLIFTVRYFDTHIANALRRTLEVDVKTYSIDISSVQFINTETKFNQERLTQIFSLIPILNDIPNVDYDNLILKIKVDGNSEQTNGVSEIFGIVKSLMIYSDAINVYNDDKIINNKGIIFPGIPIVSIKQNERLEVIMKLKKDIAKKNAIYKSCCAVGYKMMDINEKSGKSESSDNSEYNIQLTVEPCGLPIDENGNIVLIPYPRKPIKTLTMAINSIIERLSYIKENYELENNETIIIKNETYTMGELLQKEILRIYPNIFCAYNVIHPLDETLRLKLLSNTETKIEDTKMMYKMAINNLITIFNNILKEVDI